MGGFVFHRADGRWLLRAIQPAGGHTCRRIHKFRGTLQQLYCLNIINYKHLTAFTQPKSAQVVLTQLNTIQLPVTTR